MARQREKFRKGAMSKGIDEASAMRIFDKIEKFASYGFNKSHAAAYGFLSYVTAYLKAHHPKEWMAALMTTDLQDLSRVAKLIRECQSMGIAMLPPDINESAKEFAATPKGIRFAMTGIKGVGEGVVSAIIEERSQKGPFQSLEDFCRRIDTKKVGKKLIELLVEAGCFDFTGWPRQAAITTIDSLYENAARAQKENARGILSLFGDQEKTAVAPPPPPLSDKTARITILRRENELLGFYLSGHPLDDYRGILKKLSCIPLSQLDTLADNAVGRCAFIIETVQTRISAKSQRKFAILSISDGLERFELPIWPELYEEKLGLIREGQLIYAVLQVTREEGNTKLQCKWLEDLTRVDERTIQACDTAYDRAKGQIRSAQFREKKAAETTPKEPTPSPKQLCVKIHVDQMRLSHVLELKNLFRTFPGSTPVKMEFYRAQQRVGVISVESNWGVQFNKQFEEKFKTLKSIQSFEIL